MLFLPPPLCRNTIPSRPSYDQRRVDAARASNQPKTARSNWLESLPGPRPAISAGVMFVEVRRSSAKGGAEEAKGDRAGAGLVDCGRLAIEGVDVERRGSACSCC